MNAVRIAILVAAAIAAIAVAFFVRQAMTSPAPVAVQVEEQRPVTRVLAARQDLAVGDRVSASDFYWQTWPEEGMTPGYIVEGRGQDASDFAGSVVRAQIRQGEPITGRRLVQQGDAGFMSAVLSPGMRAVAVPISADRGAGGFILPNDRVDVIVSFVEEDTMGMSRNFMAQTIVENARVLAIDQTFAEVDGECSVVGETATLELSPDQARAVSMAVIRGEVALVLRALADAEGGPMLGDGTTLGEATASSEGATGVTVIRFGRVMASASGEQ